MPIGGGEPVVVQSMTNTDTKDAVATAAQVAELARAGSEVVRITVNNRDAAARVPEIIERLRDDYGVEVPLVGDFHFHGVVRESVGERGNEGVAFAAGVECIDDVAAVCAQHATLVRHADVRELLAQPVHGPRRPAAPRDVLPALPDGSHVIVALVHAREQLADFLGWVLQVGVQGHHHCAARMLEAGEDPLYVARRLVRFASEDIGNADPRALQLAVAAKDAVHFLGMPEGNTALAQLVAYMAAAPKSNAAYVGYGAAAADATGDLFAEVAPPAVDPAVPRLTSANPADWPVHADWQPLLIGFWASDTGRQLLTQLQRRLDAGAVIYPPQPLRALQHLSPGDVRVLILGQDPYHGPRQAHGLCFSVTEGVEVPPSLVNIFAELRDDLQVEPPTHGNLGHWARQGVLLLNAVLTVRAPRDGRLLQVNVRAGEFAPAAAMPEPLMMLGDVDKFQARAEVDEQNAPLVSADQPASAYLKGDRGKKLDLRFVRIEPYVSAQPTSCQMKRP